MLQQKPNYVQPSKAIAERASGFDRRRGGMAKEAMMMVVECAL
jgi:hypothetical protein